MNIRTSRRGSSAPTISDVARAAGVSLMTVSRVINNEANVRPTTREKVEAAIAQLNYAPNPPRAAWRGRRRSASACSTAIPARAS